MIAARRIPGLWLAVLTILIVGGAAPLARAEILIATVGPMRGQYANFGEQLRQGAARAVADINATGGVDGEQLALEAADDACDARQALTVASQLVAKGVKLIAGHFCSGSSIAAAKVYEDAGVVMISPSSTNPKFTDEGGWNVHRLGGRDDAQGSFAGKAIAKAFAGKNVAIIDDGSVYGMGLANAFKTALNAGGLTEKLRETYAPALNDYTELVQKILTANIDVLYVGGFPGEAGTIIRQLSELASTALLVGGDALLVEQFWATAGTSGEGALVTFAQDAQKLDAARAVTAAFKSEGINPEGFTLHAYAAVQAFAQAATATRGTDGKAISQWLRAGNPLNTVLGVIALDAKGDLQNPPYSWYRWSQGKFTEVRPFP
jgi:branched-chain amino acid transport system substrate-binding protein